jgi:hypothetical protein
MQQPGGSFRARYVSIEERTDSAGWLVLRGLLSQSVVRGYKEGFDVAIIDHSPSSDIRVSW